MISLLDNQLVWLEEKSDSYVEVYSQPQGKPFIEGISGKVVKIRDLHQYIGDHLLENLWRSWIIYEDTSKSKPIGELPAVVDIDDESNRSSISFPLHKTPNLEKAYELTRICSAIIIERWAKSEDRVRFIFSGHKGFHIEFKPIEPVDMKLLRKELIEACTTKGLVASSKASNIFFETTSIDNINREVRLTGSLNSWQNDEGQIYSRRVIQLTLDEFLSLKLEGIILRSELRSG
jgi:hypothetical protein